MKGRHRCSWTPESSPVPKPRRKPCSGCLSCLLPCPWTQSACCGLCPLSACCDMLSIEIRMQCYQRSSLTNKGCAITSVQVNIPSEVVWQIVRHLPHERLLS